MNIFINMQRVFGFFLFIFFYWFMNFDNLFFFFENLHSTCVGGVTRVPGVSPRYECQARVGIPWACGHSGLSLSPSVSLSLSHLARVVKYRKLSLKFIFQRAISEFFFLYFFSPFFVNAKCKRRKCFANWHILFIVWFRLPNKWYTIYIVYHYDVCQAHSQHKHTHKHTRILQIQWH